MHWGMGDFPLIFNKVPLKQCKRSILAFFFVFKCSTSNRNSIVLEYFPTATQRPSRVQSFHRCENVRVSHNRLADSTVSRVNVTNTLPLPSR